MIRYLRTAPFIVILGGAFVTLLFSLAMVYCPDRNYNPCMRMLSYLGRTQINRVHDPLCHDLFMSALILSAGIVTFFYPALSCFVKNRRSKTCLRWGGTLTATGLLMIAFIPENVSAAFHNIGCFAAALGGAITMIILAFKHNNPKVSPLIRWGWLAWSAALITVFEFFFARASASAAPLCTLCSHNTKGGDSDLFRLVDSVCVLAFQAHARFVYTLQEQCFKMKRRACY